MAALSPLERELGRVLRVVLPEQREATDEEGPQAMDESDDFYECANLERFVALVLASGSSFRLWARVALPCVSQATAAWATAHIILGLFFFSCESSGGWRRADVRHAACAQVHG